MTILDKFLNKCGVKNFSDLNNEEKETYRSWQEVLEGKQITDAEVKVFLDNEEDEAIKKLTTSKLNTRDDIFLKMKLEFVRKIKGFLLYPEQQKKMLEQNINQLM